MRTPVAPVSVERHDGGNIARVEDLLVTEEPLEIRLGHGPEHDRKEIRLSVTMRTPGHDEELALGFLFTEGLINDPQQVVRVAYCENVKVEERGNVVRAELHPSVDVDPAKWQRNFYTTSSCGVCGKSSIDAVHVQCTRPIIPFGMVDPAVITALPDRMRQAQTVFTHTGGIHAAASFWTKFLRSLKTRGLSGVRLVISDAHAGLKAAIRKCFTGASWQRCRVHFARNLLALVPKSHKDMVAALFRTIFAQPGPKEVAATWDQVRDQLAKPFPKIGPLMDDAKAEVLAFTAFPKAHWPKIWSNNPIERLNKEIKRRSRVVGIFPNEAAVIRLIGAVLADAHDEWQVSDRRYLSETSMALLYPTSDTDTAAVTSGT